MKLIIPNANKVFKKNKTPAKKQSFEQIIIHWLNTNVYDEIMNATPKLSTQEVKVTGHVTVEIPPFEGYYNNKKEFERIVMAKLVPLGYNVEITHDGVGMGDICIITWEQTL